MMGKPVSAAGGALTVDGGLHQVLPTFAEVFRSELTYVWNTLRRLGIPTRDLEDVSHEVFVVVHRQLQGFDASRPLRPWLFGIAYRCASSFRRRAGYRREALGVEGPGEPTATAPLPDEHMEREQRRALVWKALDTLPLDRRAVVVLHDFEGATAGDIAASLEIPVRTVYSRLRVAREELAAAMRELRAKEERR